jgi:hypothetical protein
MTTRARHLSLSWSKWIQSTPPTVLLILYSHRSPVLRSGLFPSRFVAKMLYVFLIYPCVLHALPVSVALILYHPNNNRRTVKIIKLLIMQISPAYCHLLPRRCKQCIQHHVTERHGRVVSIPTSYSGGPGFKSRPGDRLPRLRFSWFFSVPPGKFRDSTLN